MRLVGIRKFSNLTRRFAGDTSGNFAVLTAFSITAIVMAVGFGVNLSQAFQVKFGLQAALDAAVTSTARDITLGIIKKQDAREAVEKILAANADDKFTDKRSFVLDTLTMDDVNKTLEATAYAYVDTAFPLFGHDPRVAITSAALYSDKKVEIAMMLDVTRSMKGWKIEALKTAAQEAVETALDSQDPKNPRIRMALIPYAEAVNTGELGTMSVFKEVRGGVDLPPAIDPLVSFVASAANLPGDNCATERKDVDGNADFTDDDPYVRRSNKQGKEYLALVNRDDRLSVCPTAELVPLTGDSEKLIASIGEFEANGVTAGAIALQWGYYMLSSKWRPVIKDAGLGGGPSDANTKKVAKVAVLMTDGLFNTAFAGLTDRQRTSQNQEKASRSYAESICANMKFDDIEIYTIGFDIKNESGAATLLKTCASPDKDGKKHYFEAATSEELKAAFKEIILNSERLALTK